MEKRIIVVGVDGSDGSTAAVIWCARLVLLVDADLIVVGRRGRGGFADVLLGGVPQQLVRHSKRPVVIVPAE